MEKKLTDQEIVNETEQMPFSHEPITHETFLIGFDKNKGIVFFKSYIYSEQKKQCQADLKWVIDNLDHWEIGAATEWKLSHEDETFDIKISHPYYPA